MAAWQITCVFVAYVDILTAQNDSVNFEEELPLLGLPVIPVNAPGGVCSSLSCKNRLRASRYCRCDDMCGYYGDCCLDVKHSPEDFPTSYPPRDIFECRSLPGLDNKTGVNDAMTGYLMVSGCPEGTSKEMKCQCEDEPDVTSYVKAEMFLPIKDQIGFIYKNIHCARCNGVDESNISIWEAAHDCWTCPFPLKLLPEYKVQLFSTHCSLLAHFQWESARSCSTGLVDSCPPDLSDNDIINKCLKYFSPVTWNSKWYKNQHCAICNGVTHYLENICKHIKMDTGYNHDLFGGLRFLNIPVLIEPTVAVEVEVQEIRRLSQCTGSYPQRVYLAVSIPNNRLQSHSCPYFGERVGECVSNELQRLTTNDTELLLWKQIVKLPNTDPFAMESTLFFHIPLSLTLKPYWEQTVAEIYSFLMLSKDYCDFKELFLLHVCGNMSFPGERIASCGNLLEFNSSDILLKVSNDGVTEFLNPWTMEPVNDVSWFAFEARVNENKILTYKTEICQVEQYRRQSTTSDQSSTTKRRLSPVELIFSNICISISIICLLLTFITYCVFPSLRNSFGITLMNFVAAFALGQIFIHFVGEYLTQWQVICTVVAIATHFFWLSTFAWMSLLAWHLKSTFDRKELRTEKYTSRKTMLRYFCCGWIVPLFIVSICCTLFFVFKDTIPITYGLVRGVTCWIGNRWFALYVVIVPLAGVIAVNGVLFSRIVIGIRRSRFRSEDPEVRLRNFRGNIAELLIYIKISLLMGFIWVFGFFISFDKSMILWYTYYTLQALQGILIILLFGLNRRVRSMWRSKLRAILRRDRCHHLPENRQCAENNREK